MPYRCGCCNRAILGSDVDAQWQAIRDYPDGGSWICGRCWRADLAGYYQRQAATARATGVGEGE